MSAAWKPYAIVGAALGASVIGGIGVYHMVNKPGLGFTITWPVQGGGLGAGNDAGTMMCDAPLDYVDATPSDGYYWGSACPPGSELYSADFRGKADPSATITLYRNNRTTLIGTTTSNSDGEWSIPGVPIPEGRHTILAEATLGNKGMSVAHDIFVDTTGPEFVLDGWEVPDGIDVGPGGAAWIALCGCPDWCPQGIYQDLQACPGGYKCGAGGACHTEYTAEEFQACMESRRAGCIEVTSAPSTDLHGARTLVTRIADFAQAGSWPVVGNSKCSTKTGSTTTRIKLDANPEGGYRVGDTILIMDVGTCNLSGNVTRIVSARGTDYVDITVPLSPAISALCPVRNISGFVVLEDPRTGIWAMTVGEKVQARGHVNQPTVAAIASSAPWWVTVNSPYLDMSVDLGEIVDSAEVATQAQIDAWWAQNQFPAWVEYSECVIPIGIVNEDGSPLHCFLPDEWSW